MPSSNNFFVIKGLFIFSHNIPEIWLQQSAAGRFVWASGPGPSSRRSFGNCWTPCMKSTISWNGWRSTTRKWWKNVPGLNGSFCCCRRWKWGPRKAALWLCGERSIRRMVSFRRLRRKRWMERDATWRPPAYSTSRVGSVTWSPTLRTRRKLYPRAPKIFSMCFRTSRTRRKLRMAPLSPPLTA